MKDELESFHNKFRSGNSVTVGQAVVTRAEYEAIQSEIEASNAKIDRLTSRGIEDMRYQLDLQKKYLLESAAQINGLNYSLTMLIGSATNNTGNEPSISVYHRALNEAHEALSRTPAQSLNNVRAKAVMDYEASLSSFAWTAEEYVNEMIIGKMQEGKA